MCASVRACVCVGVCMSVCMCRCVSVCKCVSVCLRCSGPVGIRTRLATGATGEWPAVPATFVRPVAT